MTELFPDERTQFRNWQWIACFLAPVTLWVTMSALIKSGQLNIHSSLFRYFSLDHMLSRCSYPGMRRNSNYQSFFNEHVYDECPLWRHFNSSINGVLPEKNKFVGIA